MGYKGQMQMLVPVQGLNPRKRASTFSELPKPRLTHGFDWKGDVCGVSEDMSSLFG